MIFRRARMSFHHKIDPKKFLSGLWIALGILFTVALLSYHFFVNLKCPFYPWWHEFDRNDDISGVYIAQTMALFNRGDLVFVDHPGGTIYMLYGFYLRAVSLFSSQILFNNLSLIPDMQGAFHVLNQAMFHSRIFNFFLMALFQTLWPSYFGRFFWV